MGGKAGALGSTKDPLTPRNLRTRAGGLCSCSWWTPECARASLLVGQGLEKSPPHTHSPCLSSQRQAGEGTGRRGAQLFIQPSQGFQEAIPSGASKQAGTALQEEEKFGAGGQTPRAPRQPWGAEKGQVAPGAS